MLLGEALVDFTGKKDFLEVARRLADHIGSLFGPGRRREVPEHQELEIALIQLYRLSAGAGIEDLLLREARR